MRLVKIKKITARREWGCPRTKSRSNWCHAWCAPRQDGSGDCGRVAPHGIVGRTQAAILNHKQRTAV